MWVAGSKATLTTRSSTVKRLSPTRVSMHRPSSRASPNTAAVRPTPSAQRIRLHDPRPLLRRVTHHASPFNVRRYMAPARSCRSPMIVSQYAGLATVVKGRGTQITPIGMADGCPLIRPRWRTGPRSLGDREPRRPRDRWIGWTAAQQRRPTWRWPSTTPSLRTGAPSRWSARPSGCGTSPSTNTVLKQALARLGCRWPPVRNVYLAPSEPTRRALQPVDVHRLDEVIATRQPACGNPGSGGPP
jgi:hypothetical protein